MPRTIQLLIGLLSALALASTLFLVVDDLAPLWSETRQFGLDAHLILIWVHVVGAPAGYAISSFVCLTDRWGVFPKASDSLLIVGAAALIGWLLTAEQGPADGAIRVLFRFGLMALNGWGIVWLMGKLGSRRGGVKRGT